MFFATVKELTLFVALKPKFDIPVSELDHICCPQRKTIHSDLSCNSQSFDMMRFSDAWREVDTHKERKRFTIALNGREEPFWPSVSNNTQLVSSVSEHDSFSIAAITDSSSHSSDRLARIIRRPSECNTCASSGAKVKITTPLNSPSSIRRRLREDLSFYDCSPSRDKIQTGEPQPDKGAARFKLLRKGKEKRNSAPPVLGPLITRDNDSIPLNRLPRPVIHKYQNYRLRSQQEMSSNSSYPSKLFELDLSPIIEDVHAFGELLPAPLVDGDASSADSPLESSTSSYGELLYDRQPDYFGLSGFELFRDIYRSENHSKIDPRLPLSLMHEESIKEAGDLLSGDVLSNLALKFPSSLFRSSTEFLNFDADSSGELAKKVVSEAGQVGESGSWCDSDDDVQLPFRRISTCHTLDKKVSDFDRSRNQLPHVNRPLSLVARSCGGGNTHQANTSANTLVLATPSAKRLDGRLSRFGQYVRRRIKSFSVSGTQPRDSTSNTGNEAKRLRRATGFFSIYSAGSNRTEQTNFQVDERLRNEGERNGFRLSSLISYIRRNGA